MKKILHYLADFIRHDFSLVRYGLSFTALALLFVWYYNGGASLLIQNTPITSSVFYPIFISIILTTFYLISVGKLNKKQVSFILFTFLVLILNHFSKGLSSELHSLLDLDNRLYIWFRKSFINFQKVAALTLPLLIAWHFQKPKLDNFYGFSSRGFDWKPYLIMLGIMLPLVFVASLNSSFQAKYPRYRPGIAEEAGLISSYLSVGIFEITYLLRFVGVEAFFRGFLIIGGALVFGRKAILPAACIYSAWHFGKPMGEAIGAFFGGYILGVIALRSKSIMGGIAIHYGIAILMEIFAWLSILRLA